MELFPFEIKNELAFVCRGHPWGCEQEEAASPRLPSPWHTAEKTFLKISVNPEHSGVKVCVQTKSWNGFSYILEDMKTKGDFNEDVWDGVSLHWKESTEIPLGSEMDYVEDKLSLELVFNSPNIRGILAVDKPWLFETSGLIWL